MSNGTYCSASHRMDSESSSSGIVGSMIFLTMTEWPDTDTATFGFFTPVDARSREIVSTTREESMIAPSTIASGESTSRPALTSWNVPSLPSFNSTSFTADEPMSRPTRFFAFRNSTIGLPSLDPVPRGPDAKRD